MPIFNGTNGNDTINGGNGDDSIFGMFGDDFLFGHNGNDFIRGGVDDDLLDGGNGNDVLFGDEDDDTLNGGNGLDELRGGDGNDIVNGGNDDDVMSGDAGDDAINGGNGIDLAGFGNSSHEYSIYRSGGNLHVVQQAVFGSDGHDVLTAVERLEFSGRTLDLTGAGGNNAPVAPHVFVSTTEDVGTYSSGAAGVLSSVFDVENSALTVTNPGTIHGSLGLLVLNADGTFTYTPNGFAQSLSQGDLSEDIFEYTVSDGSLTDTAFLIIQTSGVNDAPEAAPDMNFAFENEIVDADVLFNDFDPDGDAAGSFVLLDVSVPAGQGTVTIQGGYAHFDPGTDFDYLALGETGSVVIEYTMADGYGLQSSSTHELVIFGENDDPVANADVATTEEDKAIQIAALANDTDVDNGAVLRVIQASVPSGQGSVRVTDGRLIFDPQSDFLHLSAGESAQVVIEYVVQDEFGATASSSITVTINGSDSTVFGTGFDDHLVGSSGDDRLIGRDGDDVLDGGDGKDELFGGDGADVINGENGDDYIIGGAGDDVIDGGDGNDMASFFGASQEFSIYSAGGYLHVEKTALYGAEGHDRVLNVERLEFNDRIVDLTGASGNNSPIAPNVIASVGENAGTYSSGSAGLLANVFDVEGDVLTVTNPGSYASSLGTLVLNADGTFAFTPSDEIVMPNGEVYEEWFAYAVSDGNLTASAWLVVQITGENDAPQANPDEDWAWENEVTWIDLGRNDWDMDVNDSNWIGEFSVRDGKGYFDGYYFDQGTDFDYLHYGETATVVIDYTLADDHGLQSSSTHTITIYGYNDAPVANPDAVSVGENEIVAVDVLANDTDVDQGTILNIHYAYAPVGQGSASVVDDLVVFDPGSDFDYLAAGESAEVVIDYGVGDEFNEPAFSTITVTVIGADEDLIGAASLAYVGGAGPELVDLPATYLP